MRRKLLTITASFIGSLLILVLPVMAAAPTGDDTFQLLASPFTGGDNTGDGGTGAAADLNYFYVGQTFTTTVEIKSGGTTSANIWIDFDNDVVSASNLTDGSFYPSYSGQVIDTTQVRTTGFRTSGTSSGTGTFATVDWTVDEPNAAAYGTGTPVQLDIDVGVIGETTESNISLAGSDILDDEEDFDFHAWADTRAPYALDPSPADTATSVAVESNYTFDLRDSLNGEGDNSGSGTGVDTAEPPGVIEFNSVSETDDSSFSCSGIFGTELCDVTVNPDPPSGISGDTRNFDYNTVYTVDISGFRDLASASQDQLGDANGPNTMSAKQFTFTTEADTVPPEVVAETPTRSSSGNSVSTNLIIDIHDKKAYPGTVSGTGVDSSTCDINVSSPSFTLTTFEEGDAGVTVTAIDYGYRFTIDPSSDFSENETVSVSVFNCEDVAGNTMVTDNYTFSTSDTTAPFVDQQSPGDDGVIDGDENVVFHIKDTGVGVDLSEVVIFVNGVYYTDGGGAGSVTTTDTSITFASSLDFNGGNYGGDTTGVTGTSTDYTFTLNPASNFSSSESVPVIIYAEDTSGNVMERVVYAFAVTQPGGGGGGGGGSGGVESPRPTIYDDTVSVIQIDETSVLVSWNSNRAGVARVLYDTVSHRDDDSSPQAGYPNATSYTTTNEFRHQIVVDGLESGTLYFFRPQTKVQNIEATGDELVMAPRFAVEEVFIETEASCPEPEPLACPIQSPVECPDPVIVPEPGFVCPIPIEPFLPPQPSVPPVIIEEIIQPILGGIMQFEVLHIFKLAEGYRMNGTAEPNKTITILIF